MSETQMLIGLCVLGVVLLLAVVGAILVITWICLKLKQHDDDILKLQGKKAASAEPDTYAGIYSTDLRVRSNESGTSSRNADSAIEINELDISRSGGEQRRTGSSVRRRLTIKIHKEEAIIYGRQAPLGQVMMAAQNYYKSQTNDEEDVPVESMEVVDGSSRRQNVLSKVFTDDWRAGTPTSFLLNGAATSFEDVVTQNKGVFIHQNIGPGGGRLDISGISLLIPAGALDRDVLVSVGVLWDEKYLPKLTKKQTLLSPIILCQPSGLTFKTTVSLTFPHAAENITSHWIPRILKREGDLDAVSDWTAITLEDYGERHVDEHRISLKLHHFTLYTLIGESSPGKVAAKLVHLVAFTNKPEIGSFFKPRIYCLNKYKELADVKEMLGDLNISSDMADTTELIIKDNGKDVLVELTSLTDGWNVNGTKTEVLPFENIWHGFHPHCTFLMKPKVSTVSEIVCEFQTYQSGDDNHAAKLKIAEMIAVRSSVLGCAKHDPLEDLTRELLILLDPRNDPTSDAGDWTSLASKMGCSVTRVRWLGTQSSPTRVLLEKWLEDKRTFRELMQLLADINRPDAAEEVRTRLDQLERAIEPATEL